MCNTDDVRTAYGPIPDGTSVVWMDTDGFGMGYRFLVKSDQTILIVYIPTPSIQPCTGLVAQELQHSPKDQHPPLRVLMLCL